MASPVGTYFGHLSFNPIISTIAMPTEEELKYEAARLKTFATWTNYDRASPIYLARSGFVYTGTDDVVRCFSCDVRKGNWTRNMDPMTVHRELSPNCVFCQNTTASNIQLFVPEQTRYNEILSNLHVQYCGGEAAVYNSTASTYMATALSSASQMSDSETQTQFPVVATDSGAADTSVQVIGIGGMAAGESAVSQTTPARQEQDPMKQESNRFASYDGNWPQEDTPDTRDLAKAGFFYTGTVDRVQCAFCRGILRNWEEEDVPMDEHRRHFPMCPFVMGLDVGNIQDEASVIAAARTNEFMNVTQPVVSDSSLGIVTERPKHTQYAVEAARVTSYRNWPSGKEQTPELLAKAGFFFAGFGDSVKCFFCDGGLRTWEHGDDPWVEHAKWFPRCPYVRQVKGEEFIQQAKEGMPKPLNGHINTSAGVQSPESSMASSLNTPGDPGGAAINTECTRETDVKQLPAGGDSGYKEGSDEEMEDESLLRENEELREQRLCKICMSADVNVVFLPCGHLVSCVTCAPALPKCPICRAPIRGTVRTYIS